MHVFQKLRALSAFERDHLNFFSSAEDPHLIAEIGSCQAQGSPMTLKQLLLLDVGSLATVQRRLRRLTELGLVHHKRTSHDRRAVELTLTPKCLRMLAKYDELMSAPPGREGADSGPVHVCGLCDSDAGRDALLLASLSEGLGRGDQCILVAPRPVAGPVVAQLGQRRKVSELLVISEGSASAQAQLAVFQRIIEDAARASRPVRLAADMTWIFTHGLAFEAVLDIESRFDVLSATTGIAGLCIYDTRRFSGTQLLQTMRRHRDHARYPAMLSEPDSASKSRPRAGRAPPR